jgi:hypothetical protein
MAAITDCGSVIYHYAKLARVADATLQAEDDPQDESS